MNTPVVVIVVFFIVIAVVVVIVIFVVMAGIAIVVKVVTKPVLGLLPEGVTQALTHYQQTNEQSGRQAFI